MQKTRLLSEFLISVTQIEEDVAKEADSYLIIQQLKQLKKELEKACDE